MTVSCSGKPTPNVFDLHFEHHIHDDLDYDS